MAVKLPGSDVYRRDQICYLDETNQKGAAARLLRAGYILFRKTPLVEHFQQNENLDFPIWYYSNEYIIDLTRIQACIEHYINARILLSGFVVHQFKKSSKPLYDKLKDTSTGLVTIKDLRLNTSFTYISNNQHNEIQELSHTTWGFHKLIELRSIHMMPIPVVVTVIKNNRIRNTLHFTEAEPEDFNPESIKEVITFVESTIIPLLDRLADELKIPNLKYTKFL